MKLTPYDVKSRLEADPGQVCFVDVRTFDEFKSGHLPGAICVPLDKIVSQATPLPRDKVLILGCQSGKRSAQARELLELQGFSNVLELQGGFSAWKSQGLPVRRLRATIPVIRQVMLTAGALVATGSVLALVVDPMFALLPIFVGSGLMFAGLTGWCGMALLLERMPWNRDK